MNVRADITTIPGARIRGNTIVGDKRDILNPSDGEIVAQSGWISGSEVGDSVEAACSAFPGWAAMPGRQRGDALRKIAGELRDSADRLAHLVTTETGKRLGEAKAEVELSAKYFDWFAEAAVIADIEEGRVSPNRRFRVRRHPVGVVAALGTWNFPLSIPARKVAAAIAAGCPTVLKPSEVTPVSADQLVQICERHLPVGVIGMVVGDGALISNALIDDTRVAAVSFTGSTPIGSLVGERCARSMTRSVLELGGRAPFIVREDANVAEAVDHLMAAKLRNNGESCIAANNVFVHTSQYDEFRDTLAHRVRNTRPGAPLNDEVDLGPLINDDAVHRMASLIDQAEQSGATVVRGHEGPSSGSFSPVTLVDDAKGTEMWSEEIFGPVIGMTSYEDETTVSAEVNRWNSGLAGYICGSNEGAAQDLAEQLRIGIIGINNAAPNTPEVPFGGFGTSGLGREGGMAGYDEFTELQTISIAR